MRPVQSAESSVKFLSSPMAPGRYIAAIATRSIDQLGHPEDIEPIWSFAFDLIQVG